MNERHIRPLRRDDFAELMRLEEEVFGGTASRVLSRTLRLCCEFFADTCFIAEEKGRAVGYVCLCAGARRIARPSRSPDLQGSRVAVRSRALVGCSGRASTRAGSR